MRYGHSLRNKTLMRTRSFAISPSDTPPQSASRQLHPFSGAAFKLCKRRSSMAGVLRPDSIQLMLNKLERFRPLCFSAPPPPRGTDTHTVVCYGNCLRQKSRMNLLRWLSRRPAKSCANCAEFRRAFPTKQFHTTIVELRTAFYAIGSPLMSQDQPQTRCRIPVRCGLGRAKGGAGNHTVLRHDQTLRPVFTASNRRSSFDPVPGSTELSS